MWKGGLRGNPDFLRLWLGQTISMFGTQVTFLALPTVAILQLHASVFQVGVLQALQFLPFLPFGLFAGAWTDRRRRRPIMIGTDLGRMMVLASIPLAFLLGDLTFYQLYAVATVVGGLNVFSLVAYQSHLPDLVERGQLVQANAKLQLSNSAAAIGGPVMAGFLIDLVGPSMAITADAVSFLLSAAAVASIRRPEPGHPSPGSRTKLGREMHEGVMFVFRDPLLRITSLNAATVNFGNYLAYTVLLVFAYRQLHLTPGLVGIVFGLGSVGWLIGALTAPRWSRRLGLGKTLTLSNVLMGVGELAFPAALLGSPVAVLALSHLVVDIGWPTYNVTQQGLRQAITPARLQGRMNGITRTMTNGAIPLASFASGVLGSSIGIVPTLVLGGTITLLSSSLLAVGGVLTVRDPPGTADAAGGRGEELREQE
jgi:MFS family permease